VKDDNLSSGRSNDEQFRADSSFSPLKKMESTSAVATAVADSGGRARGSLQSFEPPQTNDTSGLDQFSDISQAVSHYQSELVQKDELIAALIHQLEQAVEQLDRLQRTGGNRGQSSQSSSPFGHAETLGDSQSPLVDDLRRMADDWERSQPASMLERIESQLSAVHELMLDIKRHDYSGTEKPRVDNDDFEERVRRLNLGSESTAPHESVEKTLEQPSSSWDVIRKQYLESEPASQQTDHQSADAELLKLISETPTPQEINFTAATIEDLKQAVVERDAYIVQLNRLFRTRNMLSLPADWATLANVPAEMQVRVEALIEHLDVQVRLGEVEMSLERARLARERSQLQGEREQIEKHMRRLGLNSLADLDNISNATGTASDRRWMRFLGPNTK
jgi:hypothetical protein